MKILFLIIIIVSIIFLFSLIIKYHNFKINESIILLSHKNGKLIDLKKPLEPWYLYQNISCEETKSVNSISIIMCLYDSDNFVSFNIRKYKIYEQNNIGKLV
jgi:hypothetical protein